MKEIRYRRLSNPLFPNRGGKITDNSRAKGHNYQKKVTKKRTVFLLYIGKNLMATQINLLFPFVFQKLSFLSCIDWSFLAEEYRYGMTRLCVDFPHLLLLSGAWEKGGNSLNQFRSKGKGKTNFYVRTHTPGGKEKKTRVQSTDEQILSSSDWKKLQTGYISSRYAFSIPIPTSRYTKAFKANFEAMVATRTTQERFQDLDARRGEKGGGGLLDAIKESFAATIRKTEREREKPPPPPLPPPPPPPCKCLPATALQFLPPSRPN